MIKKKDECQRTWYLATGTSDMLKGKNISKHFVTGFLKNLRLFSSSLRMHEKSKNVPFLKDHLKSSHKYTHVANWLVLENMSNVAIFMENIIAFTLLTAVLSIKDVCLVHICCSLRNAFEMHSQCKGKNNIWFKEKCMVLFQRYTCLK